jgi:hypothetical protein
MRQVQIVMAGLVPAIHDFEVSKNVDARDKPGHDGAKSMRPARNSHRPDFDHVGHEVLQEVLDAMLQRRGR